MSTELACCFTPLFLDGQEPGWVQLNPTADRWAFAREHVGISIVRAWYIRGDRAKFDQAYRHLIDGGMKITTDYFVRGKLADIAPEQVEADAYEMTMAYPAMSRSFYNEPGGVSEMLPDASPLDIGQGGTFDWIREVYGPRLIACIQGCLRADPNTRFDIGDFDSTDVFQRVMTFLLAELDRLGIRLALGQLMWTFHDYADIGGDPAKGIPGDQDYSSMAGMRGKPGFLDVLNSDPLGHGWYISEISKATGPLDNGIATTADMQELYDYSTWMLTTYAPPIVTIMTPDCYFTRIPKKLNPPYKEFDGSWSSFVFQDPTLSPEGAQLAALFRSFNGPLAVHGRGPGRGR